MPSYSPTRPLKEADWFLATNGSPQFLGILTSSGTTVAVNNATTATKFYFQPSNTLNPSNPNVPANYAGTLAGRVLLLQPTAAGLVLPSTSPALGSVQTVALQSVVPPVANTAPGVLLQASERVIVTMQPTEGWLQWLSNTGSASLLVWELV